MNKKEFLKSFWYLFRGYWKSEEKVKALGLLAVVISLNFALVYLLVLLNTWNNEFYNALQEYKKELFWPLIGKFSFLAFLHIAIAVYAIYLRQLLELKWRTWMTNEYLTNWLSKQAYYRLQVLGSEMDNPEQRIQQDIDEFVKLTLSLFLGFLKQITVLGAFAVVLWELSGVVDLPLGDMVIKIPGYMLWLSLLYSMIGTAMAHVVGKKLIKLNFDQQRYEADFRFQMTRVRENSESIAFYSGEAAEMMNFRDSFSYVVKNYRSLMKQIKFLNFYVNGYEQFAIIVPVMLAAPQFFAGTILLGGFMQTLNAFGRVQTALSYFVEAYDSIAQLIAVVYRLNGFSEHLEDVQKLKGKVLLEEKNGKSLKVEELVVFLPDGRNLLTKVKTVVREAESVLITGESGSGKSTFLRVLAGIWPYAEGKIVFPEKSKNLFLPQKPYLPLGTLRQAIYYPLPARTGEDDLLRQVLAKVDMSPFFKKLDRPDDWSKILSLGEQQRIAFARVLLVRPDWLFLDEATSALDERHEKDMYELLKKELPHMSIISVGHRSTLFAQHKTELHLTGDNGWNKRYINDSV